MEARYMVDGTGHERKHVTGFPYLRGKTFKAISRIYQRGFVKLLDQWVHIIADMLVPGQGEELYDEYEKEMNDRKKSLNILVQKMKKGNRGCLERRIPRATFFSQVSPTEGNQLIGDLNEEPLLNRKGSYDMETVEVVDISRSSSAGNHGVGAEEDERVTRTFGRGNAASKTLTAVDAIEISPYVDGPGEDAVSCNHTDEHQQHGDEK